MTFSYDSVSISVNRSIDTITNVAPSIPIDHASSPFTINAFIGCVISGFIGLIIGNIYSLFFQEKIQKFLSKVLPLLFRRKKSLSGKWNQNWHVISDSFPNENNSEVHLKEKRNRVSGYFTVKDNDGEEYTYYMNGKIIDNRYIEGEWFDKYDGNTYHGGYNGDADPSNGHIDPPKGFGSAKLIA